MSNEIEQCYRLFGSLLKERREASGLSQEHIGRVIGLTRVSITNIEQGRQRIMLHHAWPLARLFQIDINEICKEELEVAVVWRKPK